MQDSLVNLFNDFIEECEYMLRLRHETVRGYKQVFQTFIKLMPEINEPSSLTTELITVFFKRLQTRERIVGRNEKRSGIRDSTVRTYWSKLNAFFKWLFQKGILSKNPLDNIQPPQPVYEDERAICENDIQRIISTITLHAKNSFTLKRDILMIYLLLFCGLRRNELLSIGIADIDLQNKILTVKGKTSKSKKPRQIPINNLVMLHLEEYLEQLRKRESACGYLIISNNEDKQISTHGLKHWVKRLNRLSKVKFHLHRFRHSFACNLAKHNVSAVKIQKLMGHADLQMTMTYLRSLTVEDLRDDVNKVLLDV